MLQALRAIVTGQAGSTHRKAMPTRQLLEMPGRYRFHSTRPAPWPPYVIRSFLGTPHRSAMVVVRYAEGQLSSFGVAAVRRPPRMTSFLGKVFKSKRPSEVIASSMLSRGRRCDRECPFMSSYAARRPEYGVLLDS